MHKKPGFIRSAVINIATQVSKSAQNYQAPTRGSFLRNGVRIVFDLAGFVLLTIAGFGLSSLAGFIVAGLSCFILSRHLTSSPDPKPDPMMR